MTDPTSAGLAGGQGGAAVFGGIATGVPLTASQKYAPTPLRPGKPEPMFQHERLSLVEAFQRLSDRADRFIMLSATEKKLGMKFNGVEVTTIVPGGWAERQGVEIDDEIFEVQGEEFSKMTREQKLVVLQGPRPVAIHIKRPAIKDFYYSLTLAETKLGMGFKGARVSSVAAGGWADRSGIHPGDEIVEVGGINFASLADEQKINCFKQVRPFELRFKRPSVVSKRIAAAGVAADTNGAAPAYLDAGSRVPGMPTADATRKSIHPEANNGPVVAAPNPMVERQFSLGQSASLSGGFAANGASLSLGNSAAAGGTAMTGSQLLRQQGGVFNPQGVSAFGGIAAQQPSAHDAVSSLAMSQAGMGNASMRMSRNQFQFTPGLAAPPAVANSPREREHGLISLVRDLLACCSSSGAAAATTTQHDISYR